MKPFVRIYPTHPFVKRGKVTRTTCLSLNRLWNRHKDSQCEVYTPIQFRGPLSQAPFVDSFALRPVNEDDVITDSRELKFTFHILK